MKRPISIENRWDILYRDYPEVYDEFANVPYTPNIVDVLQERFDFSSKIVVDIGSGSGRSSIELARYAERVIGVEPEEYMRSQALVNIVEVGLENIECIDGRAEEIPLEDNSVDMVVALTATMYPPEQVIPVFIKEAMRVVKGDGLVISVDVAPGWYGGELVDVINDPDADADLLVKHSCFVEEARFEFFDVVQVSDYGSLGKILGTYGFIFGVKAIDYIKQNYITSIKWTFRVYYKKVASV